MGGPYVVRLLLLAFQSGVNVRQRGAVQSGSHVGNCITESPFTGRDVDLSMCQYADDRLNALVAEETETLVSLAQRSSLENSAVDNALETIGCRQNREEQEAPPAFAGRGSTNYARSLRSGG
eukprot:509195-Pyramimonas_sp.AAC.1